MADYWLRLCAAGNRPVHERTSIHQSTHLLVMVQHEVVLHQLILQRLAQPRRSSGLRRRRRRLARRPTEVVSDGDLFVASVLRVLHVRILFLVQDELRDLAFLAPAGRGFLGRRRLLLLRLCVVEERIFGVLVYLVAASTDPSHKAIQNDHWHLRQIFW